jgi:hypothetical protein
MSEPAFAKDHQAIGAYFCTFSALERELGETIKFIAQPSSIAANRC